MLVFVGQSSICLSTYLLCIPLFCFSNLPRYKGFYLFYTCYACCTFFGCLVCLLVSFCPEMCFFIQARVRCFNWDFLYLSSITCILNHFLFADVNCLPCSNAQGGGSTPSKNALKDFMNPILNLFQRTLGKTCNVASNQ